MPGDEESGLEPIAWDDVPRRVWLPDWEKAARKLTLELGGLTIGSLHALSASPGALRARFEFPSKFGEDVLRERAGLALTLAMRAALARNGWEIETSPGEPVVLVSARGRVQPDQVVRDVLDHRMVAAAWDHFCTGLEIAAIPLDGAGVPEPWEDLEPPLELGQLHVLSWDESDTEKAGALVVKAFAEGGPGFSDRRLYEADLTIGPFLWDAVRWHPVIEEMAPATVSEKVPGLLIPLRLKRMILARRHGSPARDPGCTVTCATFTGEQVSTIAALLAERYRGSGTLVPVAYRDVFLRLITEGGPPREPMFTMELGDRRLFLQFDTRAKLIYIDDHSMNA